MIIKKILAKLTKTENSGGAINQDSNSLFDILSTLNNNDVEVQQDISETIYFICLKHLSESLGKMQWEKREITKKKGRETIFDNDLDLLLNIRPNPYMSAITFWQTVELNRNHYGNSYVYIERDGKKIKNLWQLPSNEVEIWIDNKGYFGLKMVFGMYGMTVEVGKNIHS